MSATIATRTLNIDSFITDISQRPVIWNRNYHCNKSFMEQTWDELSQRHNLPSKTFTIIIVSFNSVVTVIYKIFLFL